MAKHKFGGQLSPFFWWLRARKSATASMTNQH